MGGVWVVLAAGWRLVGGVGCWVLGAGCWVGGGRWAVGGVCLVVADSGFPVAILGLEV